MVEDGANKRYRSHTYPFIVGKDKKIIRARKPTTNTLETPPRGRPTSAKTRNNTEKLPATRRRTFDDEDEEEDEVGKQEKHEEIKKAAEASGSEYEPSNTEDEDD
ncbi:hypothetical protein K440DRAFT_639521 [Wilcoxina mikolae CBS 423.85]|nr:hypothetical protein K440DRAFT_639521 [Wilcoxina mikolae CBS 423.85]